MTTKRVITLALVIGIGAVCAAFITEGTAQKSVYVLRAEADEDTALDLTTKGDSANRPSDALSLVSSYAYERETRNFAISVCGGDADGDTFSWRWLAWPVGRGPARVLGTGTGILGTQAVVKYPQNGSTATSKFWADTLVITADYTTGGIVASTPGGNSVAELVTDLQGYGYTKLEITEADGVTGVQAGDVTAYYREF